MSCISNTSYGAAAPWVPRIISGMAALVAIVALAIVAGNAMNASLYTNAVLYQPYVISALWATAQWAGITAGAMVVISMIGNAIIAAQADEPASSLAEESGKTLLGLCCCLLICAKR